YVLGALWLLCGVVFGIFLVATTCCKINRKLKKHKKKPQSHKQYYLWHVIFAALFTLLAIVGTGLVLGGNAKFHSRADTIIDIIIDTADEASETIYNTTGAMKMTRTNLQGTNVDASTTRFIVLCWLITVLCWVFYGAYFFLSRFAGDTCTALQGFQQDPYNNSLSSILPCDQLLSAESVLNDVSAGVYDLVNEVTAEKLLHVLTKRWSEKPQVNANISRIQQDSSFGVCNPFTGPPEYNYQPDNCTENQIRIGDIPELLRLITCVDPVNGVCNGGIPISGIDFKTVVAYTSSIQILLNSYPGMESLLNCQTVKDAFSEILEDHCEPVKRDVKIVWAGLVFLSIVMVFLVLTWTVEAYRDRNRQFSDGSVKPHHAEDRIESGRMEETAKDSVNGNDR
ncbi:hypothetical protein Ccrd_017617, partial [Cynara cardunculus var. scolymus]